MSITCDVNYIESSNYLYCLDSNNFQSLHEIMESGVSEINENDSDIFGPPRAIPLKHSKKKRPSIIPSNLRFKEERKRIIRMTVNKLNNIEDAEENLFRTCVINSTLKRLEKEVHEDRLDKLHFNYPVNVGNSSKSKFILKEVNNSNLATNNTNLIIGNDLLLPGNETNTFTETTDVSTILQELSLTSNNTIVCSNEIMPNSSNNVNFVSSEVKNSIKEINNFNQFVQCNNSDELPEVCASDTLTFFTEISNVNAEDNFCMSKLTYISLNKDSENCEDSDLALTDPLCCTIDNIDDISVRKRSFSAMSEDETCKTDNVETDVLSVVLDPIISAEITSCEIDTNLICDEDIIAKRVKCDK